MKAKKAAMNMTAVLTQPRNMFAWAAALLSIAGTGFASEVAMVSPPLTIRPGAILSVRISEPLSSDHSQVGDMFAATLTQPLVVNGIVVAQSGQPVAGRVVEVKKAGRVFGVSRLGIKLTSLTAVDGQSVPIQSQLLVHQGPTSAGRDSVAVAGTTGLGAAIGAAADSGTGAAIGAGIGAVAGTIGVLLTRGHPTVIDSETLLSFQVTAPATIETNNAPQAFRFVERKDYAQPETQPEVVVRRVLPSPVSPYSYAYYAPPGPYSYYYPYYAYPYYGPSVGFFFGFPGYYGYRSFYGFPGYYGHIRALSPVPFHSGMAAHGFHH